MQTKELLLNIRIEDVMHFASIILGYFIVFGSSMLKVPQIINIIKHHSAEGVSLVGHLIELFCYAVNLSWGIVNALSFSTYGENFFVFIQLIILVILIGHYNKMLIHSMLGIILFSSFLYVLSIGTIPRHVHEMLLTSQIALVVISRFSQIMMNYKNSSVGRLSFTTNFLALGGCGVRVLTTIVGVKWEKGKALMLAQFGTATVLNGLIVLQFLIYGKFPILSQFLMTRGIYTAPVAKKTVDLDELRGSRIINGEQPRKQSSARRRRYSTPRREE